MVKELVCTLAHSLQTVAADSGLYLVDLGRESMIGKRPNFSKSHEHRSPDEDLLMEKLMRSCTSLVIALLAMMVFPCCTDGYHNHYEGVSSPLQRVSLDDFNVRWTSRSAEGIDVVSIESNFQASVVAVQKEEGLFSDLPLSGGREIKLKGFPAVRQYRLVFQNQQNQDVEIRVKNLEYEEFSYKETWLRSKGVITRNKDPKSVKRTIAPESVQDRYYPYDYDDFVGASEHFLIRQVRGVGINIVASMVNTVQRKARILKRIDLEFIPSIRSSVTNPTRENPKIFRSNLGIYQSLFPNFRWDHEIDDGLGDILVIHTARDTAAIAPYVQHKQKRGFTVHSEQVQAGTNVKSLIKSKYNQNNDILYVLLVGDWADIKSNTLQNSSDGSNNGSPMDNEMAMVSGSDNYVDVAIGRFSAESAAQVEIQVNKTIHYENNPNAPYWNASLGIASAEGPGDDGELDKKHISNIIEHKLKPNGWNTASTEFDPNASVSGVSSAINAGVQVINYTGHGSENAWGTTGFANRNVNNLSNQNKLPFIFSVACVNGRFNKDTCFAETWLRKKNGGAVAALMSTIFQPWEPPMIGQDYMNDLLSGGYDYSAKPGSGTTTKHGKKRLGAIVFNAFNLWYAESNSGSDRETIKTWTLFGDPALQVVSACENGLADCNQNTADGCETTIDSDINNCGGCGNVCSLEHASERCVQGECILDACEAGFLDCDQVSQNGCEAQLNTDENCTSCGDDCTEQFVNAHGTCSDNTCLQGGCLAGFDDCDSQAANGCETTLGSDNNCASCGDDCSQSFPNAGGSCVQGNCQMGACEAGYADCDAGVPGCESNLGTEANCQACGDVCQFANGIAECQVSGCALIGCNVDHDNCDGQDANGCETSLTADTNCGKCGTTCSQDQTCRKTNDLWSCQDKCADQDNDGHADVQCGGNDCDDNNSNVHPAANEICNDIDDNCNNSIDEGFDVDNDGYKTCSQIPDCDDNNQLVHPGAVEIYDKIDNDCNGVIDDAIIGILGCNSAGADTGALSFLFLLLLLRSYNRRKISDGWRSTRGSSDT